MLKSLAQSLVGGIMWILVFTMSCRAVAALMGSDKTPFMVKLPRLDLPTEEFWQQFGIACILTLLLSLFLGLLTQLSCKPKQKA